MPKVTLAPFTLTIQGEFTAPINHFKHKFSMVMITFTFGFILANCSSYQL